MDCGATIIQSRRPVIARPFSVFAGQLQRIDASVAGFNRLAVGTIPVSQFLGPDPNRVGIQINGNIGAAAAILIAVVQNPGSYRSCFVYETSAARLITFPGRVFSRATFYACYEAFAVFQPDGMIFSGMEFVEG